MAIYDTNGNLLSNIYDVNGNQLNQAYDINGNILIPITPVGNLTVMSYNVQWWDNINNNTSMQENIISTYDADIIGFQEFAYAGSQGIPTFAQNLLSDDYPYIQAGNYGNRNAIASKFSLSDFATVPHTTQTMDGQSYSTAKITFHDKEIFLVTSHVTTSTYETTKVEQVQEVFEAVQGHEYFIILGDFNTVCKSIYDTEYTTIMKQFVDAGYHSANCSNQHGFLDTWTGGSSASGTWYPCDHIITSANIDINTVIVDTTKIDVASQTGQSIDHLPIIAYLTVT